MEKNVENNATCPLKITKDEGRFKLSGELDARADLSPLLTSAEPVEVDLREVDAITTTGTRRWLQFIRAWGPRQLALYGCPPPLVSLFNAVPSAVGLTEDAMHVKSVLVPFSCHRCHFYQETEVRVESVLNQGDDVYLPDDTCGICGEKTELATSADDYFVFLTWNNQRTRR